MTNSRSELRSFLDATLVHYESRADAFWVATRDHDVRQNREALIAALGGVRSLTILDFGCGPGRDLKAFTDEGHTAIGVEGVARFVEMARAFSGCEVWHQDFLALDLPAAFFDGVFANASLFHVPSQEIGRVLRTLHQTLKPGGILFSSNPRGMNEEGFHAGRYGVFYDLERWRAVMIDAGFMEISHYYRPSGRPRVEQRWLASLWCRSDLD